MAKAQEKVVSLTGDMVPSARMRSLVLERVRFKRFSGYAEWRKKRPRPLETAVSLRAELDGGVLTVGFSVRVSAADAIEAEVTHLLEFEQVASGTEDEVAETRYWQQVAARLAPIIAFPYARETIASLTGKAGAAPINLPIMNIGGLIDPDQIEIQSPDTEGEAVE